MDLPVYQRAVTPTVEPPAAATASPGLVRGKLLSYQSGQQIRRTRDGGGATINGTGHTIDLLASGRSAGGGGVGAFGQSSSIQQQPHSATRLIRGGGTSLHANDMNIQGRGTNSIGGISGKTIGVGSQGTGGGGGGGGVGGGGGAGGGGGGGGGGSSNMDLAGITASQRYDLVPILDEMPSDGIIFARIRNQPESLVVFRTPEERLRNPERLNLDRRHLEVCPLLEQEQRLRLLNFQNNNIRAIQNLENLPNLIFLDLYNNKLASLEGPVSSVRGLRVLMAGKNRISAITNLSNLRKLDVLDLHSNEIKVIEGLEGLSDLRVLNLAGNRISTVHNLSGLQSLTELNLRRNSIERVLDLDKLPALQRVFLSHNLLATQADMQCLFNVKLLIELSLDGNPLADTDPVAYRSKIIAWMPALRHLDLKKITDEERTLANEYHIAMATKEEAGRGAAMSNASAAHSDSREVNDIDSVKGGGGGGGGNKGINSDVDDLHKWKGNQAGAGAGAGADAGAGAALVSGSHPSGLAALARAGKLTPSHSSMFDLEMIGPNEKALVAIGEAWEWVQSKRLLSNVTEASLYYMKKGAIVEKFMSNMSSLPALKTLRIVNSDIETFKDLKSLTEMICTIDHFILRDCPVCVNLNLLRDYIIASAPALKTFNDIEIKAEERAAANTKLRPLLKLQERPAKKATGGSGGAGGASAGGGGGSNAAGSGTGANAGTVGSRSSIIAQQGKRSGGVSGNTKTSALGMAMGVGSNVSLDQAVTNSVNDMIQSVLTRRKQQQAFNDAFNESIEEIVLETIRCLRGF